jgi:hypothetical protein
MPAGGYSMMKSRLKIFKAEDWTKDMINQEIVATVSEESPFANMSISDDDIPF